MPRISVFMPSYNKRGFGVEAVRSVFSQTFTDWELWILDNSTDDGKTRKVLKKYIPMEDPRVHFEEIELSPQHRAQYYATAWLMNQYYPKANGDIILYISDDDLFQPGLFKSVVDYFDEHQDRHALYFHLVRTRAYAPGQGTKWNEAFAFIWADRIRSVNCLDCQIDGGQIAYRKHVLDAIGQPYFNQGNDLHASHADGTHMEKIPRAGFDFYPLEVKGVIHRHTLLSTWSK